MAIISDLENDLAELLEKHQEDADNFDEEGFYDPNPYWLAADIMNFLRKQNQIAKVKEFKHIIHLIS